MKENIKRLTIELNEDVFYALKEYCVKNKTTFKVLLTDFIKEKVN